MSDSRSKRDAHLRVMFNPPLSPRAPGAAVSQETKAALLEDYIERVTQEVLKIVEAKKTNKKTATTKDVTKAIKMVGQTTTGF